MWQSTEIKMTDSNTSFLVIHFFPVQISGKRSPISVNELHASCSFRCDLLGHTLRKLYFSFLSHWMGYDRGDSFSFDFELNGMPLGSKSNGKLSPWSYSIQCERKWKYSFLSVLEYYPYITEKYHYYVDNLKYIKLMIQK